jgi:hypothetical protein
MSTQSFFEFDDLTEESVFAALETEMRAAADNARVKAMNERVPGLDEPHDDLWAMLRKMQGGRGRLRA